MKGWIGGVVVGVVLGSTLTGTAQITSPPVRTWMNATQILTMGRGFQDGYSAGVADMLNTLSSVYSAILSAPDPILIKQTACLNTHARGTGAEFVRWATKIWQTNVDTGYGTENAANLLFAEACQ